MGNRKIELLEVLRMNGTTIEEYICSGGIISLMKVKNRDELQEQYPPLWIDNLKKGLKRFNYTTNYGKIEIITNDDEILGHHFEIYENSDLNDGWLFKFSKNTLCRESRESDVLRVIKKKHRVVYSDENIYLEKWILDNKLELVFDEKGLFSISMSPVLSF